MRWENLFDDLESQLEQELDADEVDLLAEEERLRLGRLSLRDRVRAMSEGPDAEPVRFALADGSRATVRVSTVGRDWLAGELQSTARRAASCVVPLTAVVAVFPTPAQLVRSLEEPPAATAPGSLSARLGLTFVLRDLCRRRASVDLVVRGGGIQGGAIQGSAIEGSRVHGTIDRVGRDHLDLAEHEPGALRRDRDVTAVRMLPLSELVVVRL
jgi:hypothetical protein